MTSSFSPCHVRFRLHGRPGILVKKPALLNVSVESVGPAPRPPCLSEQLAQLFPGSAPFPGGCLPGTAGLSSAAPGCSPSRIFSSPRGASSGSDAVMQRPRRFAEDLGCPSEKCLFCPSSPYLVVNGRSWFCPSLPCRALPGKTGL